MPHKGWKAMSVQRPAAAVSSATNFGAGAVKQPISSRNSFAALGCESSRFLSTKAWVENTFPQKSCPSIVDEEDMQLDEGELPALPFLAISDQAPVAVNSSHNAALVPKNFRQSRNISQRESMVNSEALCSLAEKKHVVHGISLESVSPKRSSYSIVLSRGSISAVVKIGGIVAPWQWLFSPVFLCIICKVVITILARTTATV